MRKCEHNDIMWSESQSIIAVRGMPFETKKPDIGICLECKRRVWAKNMYAKINLLRGGR